MTKNKNLSFEEAFDNLEIIVKELEEGNLDIDSSLSKFKEGIDLYRHCNKILNAMDGEIKTILEKEDGTLEEQDFNDF